MKAIAMSELRKAEDAAIEAALAIRRKDPNSERSRQLVIPKRHALSVDELLKYPLGGPCELCDLIQGIPEIVQLMTGFCLEEATERHHMVELSEGRSYG